MDQATPDLNVRSQQTSALPAPQPRRDVSILSETALTPTFVGPAEFRKVFDRFDVGAGDRFYDHPDAYRGPWNPIGNVRASLVVTHATRGELGTVRYVIQMRQPSGRWKNSEERSTTQRDFPALVSLID